MSTTQLYFVDVIEIATDDDPPAVYGKGRCVNDLVYFTLDASSLRQPDEVHTGGRLVVTSDEITGRVPFHFAQLA